MAGFAAFVVVLAWTVLAPVAAYAQAAIVGSVQDTSGAVLPGVTVEAASPALIEKVRSVVTDGTGQYRIENLRPGTYTVTFTLPGFATVRREGIELTGTFTATVNADLRVGALEETITVSGETPVVDVQNTTRQRVMDAEIFETIPSGRTEYNLGVLIPGVVLGGGQDVGGSGGQTAFPDMGIHGSKSSDLAQTLGGMSISVLTTGTHQPMRVNPIAIQEVSMDTAGGGAEHAVGGVRINRLMREGSNTFNGSFMFSLANDAMQGDNLTQELRDRGLRTPDSIDINREIIGGFGGPIRRDRLWFFVAGLQRQSDMFAAGLFVNRNVNNPNAWAYEPDLSQPATNIREHNDGSLRLTLQASPRNKVGMTWIEDTLCWCPQSARLTSALEAEPARSYPVRRIVQAEWTSPYTNRLLLEVSGGYMWGTSNQYPHETLAPGMIKVTEQATGMTYRSGDPYRGRPEKVQTFRVATSYITGAHSFQVGLSHRSGSERENRFDNNPLSYRFNNGVPNQLTQRALPIDLYREVDHDMGIFAQDKWTVGRLAVAAGVRFDHWANSFPEHRIGPAALAPARNIVLPAVEGSNYKDITPRLGASYDVFGNGRTAVKVSLNKYVTALGSGGLVGTGGTNPADNLVTETNRSWSDANRNYVADCDLINPSANGECGAVQNRLFGGTRAGTVYDEDYLRGWGKRNHNWEFSLGLQQELAPRIAGEFGYFRRAYGNFAVTDDRALTAADFDTFSITAPRHPDLPDGGAYTVTGLYDLKPARFGTPTDNLVTLSRNFGEQVEYWQGVDFTLNARPRPGVLLQGGISTGRTVTDTCEIRAKLPETALTNPFCHVATAFLTQAKFLGTYTIPRIDVQVSGTFQSLPGPNLLANYVASNALVQPSLGRPLAGNAANVTVSILEPGTLYGERLNQLDLRFGKILRFGRTRANVGIDVFNAFNSNAVLAENFNYAGTGATWRQPNEIVLARFVKFDVKFDF
jgi:hypothetical protein